MQKIQKTQSGFSGVPVLLGILALVIVGASGFYVYQKNNTKKGSVASVNETQEIAKLDPLPTDLSAVKPVDEIKSAVILPDGVTIVGVELELENAQLVYKVKLSDNSVLLFDATTGLKIDKVAEVENETEDGDVPKDSTTAVSIDQARKIASDSMPGKTIRKIKLEAEHGAIVFSVRFVDGSRVDVDATTGAITMSKTGNSGSGKSEDSQSKSGSSGSGKSDSSESEGENEHGTTAASSSGSVSEDQARTIALASHAGTIQKVESETEDGTSVFSVRFTDGARVDVRKSDGAVVKVQN